MTATKRVLALIAGLGLSAGLALFGGTGTAQAAAPTHVTASKAAPHGGAAPNTRRINCGSNPSQFLRIFNNTGTLCFADAGSLNVSIEGVVSLSSGNNAGQVNYDRAGESPQKLAFNKNENHAFNPPVRITQIIIK